MEKSHKVDEPAPGTKKRPLVIDSPPHSPEPVHQDVTADGVDEPAPGTKKRPIVIDSPPYSPESAHHHIPAAGWRDITDLSDTEMPIRKKLVTESMLERTQKPVETLVHKSPFGRMQNANEEMQKIVLKCNELCEGSPDAKIVFWHAKHAVSKHEEEVNALIKEINQKKLDASKRMDENEILADIYTLQGKLVSAQTYVIPEMTTLATMVQAELKIKVNDATLRDLVEQVSNCFDQDPSNGGEDDMGDNEQSEITGSDGVEEESEVESSVREGNLDQDQLDENRIRKDHTADGDDQGDENLVEKVTGDNLVDGNHVDDMQIDGIQVDGIQAEDGVGEDDEDMYHSDELDADDSTDDDNDFDKNDSEKDDNNDIAAEDVL